MRETERQREESGQPHSELSCVWEPYHVGVDAFKSRVKVGCLGEVVDGNLQPEPSHSMHEESTTECG